MKESGCTIVGDGKQSNAGHPLLNFLVIHRKGAEHVDTFNAEMVSRKTGEFLAVLMDSYLTSDDGDYDEEAAARIILPALEDLVVDHDSDSEDVDAGELPAATADLIKKKIMDNKHITKVRIQDVVQIVLDGAKACRCVSHARAHVEKSECFFVRK